jgi:hypothetical protein
LGIGTGSVLLAADMTNITGTVNEDGQLVEDSGQVYDIAEDEIGLIEVPSQQKGLSISPSATNELCLSVPAERRFSFLTLFNGTYRYCAKTGSQHSSTDS